ncbi:MAG: hypothetical protein R3B09_01055 [Nannocystaceae bacterium]
MKRRPWALPTLLMALSGLLVGAFVLVGDDAAVSDRAARLATAERTVVYTVTPTFGPSFRLGGAAETVLLVAHLQLPREPYTPGRSYRFALIATLRGPDGALLGRWTVSRRTRQTKADRGAEGWGYEAAFVPDGRLEVTDGAAIELALPSAPPRSRLDLRLSEETGLLDADDRTLIAAFKEPRALVRVYREVEVDDAEAAAQARGEGKGAGARRLATYLPWHALDLARRRRSVGAGWERMVAEGRTGEDYEAQGIYVAAARPSERPPTLEPAIEVAADQPAVVHVQGPTVVTLRGRWTGAREAPTPPSIAVAGRWLGDLNPPTGAGASASASPGDDRDEAGPRGHVPSDLSLQTDDLRGPEAPADLEEGARLELAADGGWRELQVSIPRGWTSLEVTSDAARAELQVLTDDPSRHVGADPHGVHRRADGRPLVPVDVRSAPHYVVGPAAAPLEVDLVGPADIYAQVLRVDARAVGAPRPLPFHVEFIDAAGRIVAELDERLEPAAPAPFERLRPIAGRWGAATEALVGGSPPIDVADEPLTLAAAPHLAADLLGGAGEAPPEPDHRPSDEPEGALGFPLGVAPVSESTSLRLIAPEGAVRARIRAEAPALVALRGLLPPSDEPRRGSSWTWPYDQVEIDDARWRYAPRRRARWFPLAADDHRRRVDAGEVMAVQGQIRLEDEIPSGDRRKGPWEAIHPIGRHPRRAILEQVSPAQRAEALRRWGPGSYAALPRGRAVDFDLRPGTWPATVSTQVIGALGPAIGESVSLEVGEQRFAWPIRGRLERKCLPVVDAARTRVTWTEGPRDAVILVDRPPRGAAPIYRRRQLHQLGPRGLSLTVDKPTQAAIAVNVVIYWIGAAPRVPSELRVELDRGAPRRQIATPTTHFTAGARTLRAAPEEELQLLAEELPRAGVAHVLRAVIALGDDVAPGRHTVRITPISGPPVWVRFFRQDDPRLRARTWQWQERQAALHVEVDDAPEE